MEGSGSGQAHRWHALSAAGLGPVYAVLLHVDRQEGKKRGRGERERRERDECPCPTSSIGDHYIYIYLYML